MDTDVFVRRLEMNRPDYRTIHLYLADKALGVSNQTLLSLWKRHLPVIDGGLLGRFLHYIWLDFRATRYFAELIALDHDYKEFAVVDSILRLNSKEEEQGKKRLAEMGIGDNDWFVCLFSRDPSYLKQHQPGRDWSYHDYRDSRIANYVEAARLISSKGGFALRMGAVVAEAMDNRRDPKIIDYATRWRDDFMDIYLSAKCRFFVGSSAGLTQVPLIFDRPIAYVNCIPLHTLHFGRSSLFIPKLFRRMDDERLLTYNEMKELGGYGLDALYTAFYRDRNIEVIENAPEDLRDICLDMFDLLENRPSPAGAAELQKVYKERFFGEDPDRVYAPDIAPRFALKYKDLILG